MSCCSSSSSCSQSSDKGAVLPVKGLHYALVGFANTGKSTLFNLLSSHNKNAVQQNVGNFSGITVAAKKTSIKLNGVDTFLSDLPGLSSLTKRSEQGQDLTISQQFITTNDIDCLINVVDVNQISRQLYLTTQLLELGVPMIVVLNKMDRQKHASVDVGKLSVELGCPVVALSAHDKNALGCMEKNLLLAQQEFTQQSQASKQHKTDENINLESESSSAIQARQDYVADVLSRSSFGGGGVS